ncbi:MAG TPA: helix-turn-helix transcriptional regulator [Actinomycetota bacterium]|nr:helix-turn-helix transcriptional regulator [Actinomycetota bacterium]
MNEAQALKRVARLVRIGRLAELREGVGLSQSDVARALGLNPSAVSRWEAGKARPKPKHAVALLELLEVDL